MSSLYSFLFLLIIQFIPIHTTESQKPIVIFLNGTSSAGKTSIAFKLLENMDKMTLHMGVDHFSSMLDPKIDERYNFTFTPEVKNNEPFVIIKKEAVGNILSLAMHKCMKTMLEHNFNLVIDDVLCFEEDLKDYLEVFKGYKVYFIAVKPPIEVAVQREKDRKDRFIGLARGLYHDTYANKDYDMEIDSSKFSPEESANLILNYINENPAPLIFFTH